MKSLESDTGQNCRGIMLSFISAIPIRFVFALPEGISAQVEKQTSLTVKGIDKELLGEIAAKMRALSKPDVI